jgi:hypothetical protein
VNLNRHLITLDVDWASDEVIELCARILIERGVKATWLITHDSAAVRELSAKPELFELGIHPNFLPGGTQGDTPEAVIEHLLAIVPGARTVRTHHLVQSTGLLRTLADRYGIEHDLSLLLPDTPGITPHELWLPARLLRFPTFWEDDEEMLRPEPSFSLSDPRYQVPGLKIFGFHPIHVALNSSSVGPYHRLKSEHDISEVSLEELRAYASDAAGAGTLFRELVEHIAAEPTRPGLTISELADEWEAELGSAWQPIDVS